MRPPHYLSRLRWRIVPEGFFARAPGRGTAAASRTSKGHGRATKMSKLKDKVAVVTEQRRLLIAGGLL
jgi:hypothetical protein